MNGILFQLVTMAASGDKSDDVVSCVYCLEVESYLVDPRMLPSSVILVYQKMLKLIRSYSVLTAGMVTYGSLILL